MHAARFADRTNADGPCDTICASCFRAFCPAQIEGNLLAQQGSHVCDPQHLVEIHEVIALCCSGPGG
jgi:hypothetical protein